MSGSASAGTQQAGTIGTANDPVDVESEDINNADTVTTQNLVVNQSATLPFAAAPVLEAGDTVTVATISQETDAKNFKVLYNGTSKDVLAGVVTGTQSDFLYTFDNNQTLRKSGTGTSYTFDNGNSSADRQGIVSSVDVLPPALNVTKIEVGFRGLDSESMGAEVILKD
jgi:hypothetical protein